MKPIVAYKIGKTWFKSANFVNYLLPYSIFFSNIALEKHRFPDSRKHFTKNGVVMYRLLIILLVMLIAGCVSNNRNETGHVNEMVFNIDPELLGDTVYVKDKRFVFQPPSGWMQLPDEIFGEAVRQMTQAIPDDELFPTYPIHAFLRPEHGSAMIVSEISIADTIYDTSEALTQFQKRITDRFTEEELKTTDFMKDGIHFYQYLIQKEDIVNFKFVFANTADEMFQIDYIVPASVYLQESRAIESSIGTINLINQ